MIKVQKQSIIKYLCNKNLQIPIYQRDYSWNEKYWTQLWEDLINCSNNNRKIYYLGNIIVHDDLIIDGQQRLITIALLSKTLYILGKKYKGENKKTRLKNFNDNFRIIQLNSNDNFIFNLIMKENEEIQNKNDKSQINKCYKFFLKKCKKDLEKLKKTPENIFEFLEKFEVSEIKVETDDRPQIIFERLNTASLKLTQTDIIKNFIFMNLEPEEQNYFYSNYWKKIEDKVTNLDEFIWHYLKTKKGKWFNNDKSSEYFRNLYSEVEINKYKKKQEVIAIDILNFIEIYNWFIQKNKYHDNKKINEELKKLSLLGVTTYYPFLLGVFNLYIYEQKRQEGQKKLKYVKNVEELLNIIRIIENLYFRMKVIGIGGNRVNRFFPSLLKRITNEMDKNFKKSKLINDGKNNKLYSFSDILIAFLLEKSKRKLPLFPDDEEFQNFFIKKKFENPAATIILKIIGYCYYKGGLINFNSNKISLDHIMPNKLTIEWKKELGENYEKIHEEWLNTLGNLVLTTKNSELSNKQLKDRQNIDYKTNPFTFIDNLVNIEKEWNKTTIKERANRLFKIALENHPKLKTNYMFKHKQKKQKPKSNTNVDKIINQKKFKLIKKYDYHFTNAKPDYLHLGEQEIKINNWKDLLILICEFFYKSSQDEFNKIKENPKTYGLTRLFSNSSSYKKHKWKLSWDQKINTNFDTEDIIKLARKLILAKSDIPDSKEIFFTLKTNLS